MSSTPASPVPDVSVVIPFRDREAYLVRCIEGLLDQTLARDRFEILMVENNSSDSSVEIVDRYPEVRRLDEPRPGAYAARNLGVAEARGSIIAFTDADCVPAPDWLERLLGAMADPEVGVVQGDRDYAGGSRVLKLVAAYESEKNAYIFNSQLADRYHAFANNMAVRRSLFEELGPFPAMARGADVIFLQRVIRAHTPAAVRFCPDARVVHLEITGLIDWFRKMFIYGKSYEHYRRVEPCRPLNYRERVSVLRGVRERGDGPSARSVLLFPILVPGALCYEAGRWFGRRMIRRQAEQERDADER